jgi:hypothetical protein
MAPLIRKAAGQAKNISAKYVTTIFNFYLFYYRTHSFRSLCFEDWTRANPDVEKSKFNYHWRRRVTPGEKSVCGQLHRTLRRLTLRSGV